MDTIYEKNYNTITYVQDKSSLHTKHKPLLFNITLVLMTLSFQDSELNLFFNTGASEQCGST